MYKFICFKFKFMLRSLCLYVNDDKKKTNYSTFYSRHEKNNQTTTMQYYTLHIQS